jgi:hypothetical protein
LRIWPILFLVAAQIVHAADAREAMPTLLKVLTYDLNFDARGAGDFVILVVSDTQSSKSLARDLEATGATKIKTRHVTYVPVEFTTETALQGTIEQRHVSAIIVSPGASDTSVKIIWELSQDNQLYALALEARAVEQFIPVGIFKTGDKIQPIINDKSAKAVGIRFETAVMRLARVIQ